MHHKLPRAITSDPTVEFSRSIPFEKQDVKNFPKVSRSTRSEEVEVGGLDFVQIPRVENAEADFLARLALSDDYNAPSEPCIKIRGQPSTEGEQVLKIEEHDEWMTPIVRYLKEGWLPKDKTEVRKI